MASDNIEKLKKQIEKDPSSKLFVPLAEEYRKAGMLEEAAGVLKAGLERQPAYMSARVALGKIYLEKKMLNEAVAEFEQVVKAIPDNILAHRKLADAYRELGLTPTAIEHYKKVLELSPAGDEVRATLEELERPAAAEPAGAVSEAELEEAVELTEEGEDFILSLSDEEVAEAEGALPEFAGEAAELGEPAAAEEPASGGTPEGADAPETAGPAGAVPGAEPEEAVKKTEDAELAEVQEALSADEPPEAVEPAEEGFHEIEDTDAEDGLSGIRAAEAHINNGQYAEAINVYEGLLRKDPDDPEVLQRAQELRSLLKLLGREREAVVAKLDKFLEAINKRRDEFFGNA